MEHFELEDGSNDKAYFTMVPNIVLNHSSAVDQALYMQMKRFAGEKKGGGFCTASHRTLMGKLQIGPKALKSSIQYLLDHKWIENVGARKVMTEGGPQDVQIYRVNDIWRMNVEHYKGADESTPLTKGGNERTKGADERSKGGDESAPTKNYIKHIDTSAYAHTSQEIEEVLVPLDGESKSIKVPKDPENEKAARYWNKLCLEKTGFTPTGGLPKGIKIIKEARKVLSLPQIKSMMDDWFDEQTLEDHEMIQITRCLSSFQIDKYLAENV